MQLKMAAIGNKEALVLYEGLGMDCFYEEEPKKLKDMLYLFARERKYGIIFFAENLVKHVEKELKDISSQPIPAIIIIPMQPKSNNIGLSNIEDIAAHATGVKII